jgi:hypothetical protein
MTEERDESPEALAHALVERIFEMLHECRETLLKLETPHAQPESPNAQAERLLYHRAPPAGRPQSNPARR